jgi:hypothetical protein
MDKTTDLLFAETGITERGIEWFDALVIAAMHVGYQMATEDQKPEDERRALDGDPLKELKTPLVKYISDLEKSAKAQGMDLNTLLPAPPMPMAPMPDLVS